MLSVGDTDWKAVQHNKIIESLSYVFS